MKKNTTCLILIPLLIFFFLSCKTEREKRIEEINKKAVKILVDAISIYMQKGINMSYDSIIGVYGKISKDSAELGLDYANNMLWVAKASGNFSETPTYAEKTENAETDTTKLFELKLVGKDYFGNGQFARLNFEFKNLLTTQVDAFWLMVSLRNKEGDFLAGEEILMFDNIRSSGIAVKDALWENIKLEDIGGVLITPSRLEVNGTTYPLYGSNVKIMENKFGIKIWF